ncbi:MoaF-related domain-containing protein [Formosa sp. 4Alg 33]|uniref:MoaF-related domain-containing protein n=1 Tax=Formosa sp. 4Alg 33 TaxID=3382189 RepID=UPI003D9C2EEE
MKSKLVTLICLLVIGIGQGFAQTKTTEDAKFQFNTPEHYMDGYSLSFQYQDGKALHMAFDKGKAQYEWISGPRTGKGNSDIPYRSRKIGENLYLVNWHETGLKDYLTIIFDLDKMIIHTSIIVGYENQPDRPLKTVFLTGVIDHLKTSK